MVRPSFSCKKDEETGMPKGYIIVRVDVKDPEAYARYAAATADAVKKYGARPLVRGGKHEALEGTARTRNVVMEFDSYDQARAYYHSPEYQAARQHRIGAAEGEFVLVEGFDA
jgi:uncharacterized protein (DUF1330 family)